MLKLVYDIETDGLYVQSTKIHSLCAADNFGNKYSFADQPGYPPISEGIELLKKADVLIAHNGIAFDNQVILKLYGVDLHEKTIDTLIMSRLIHNNLFPLDCTKWRKIDKGMWGRHSLKAWGQRLSNFKDDYTGGWSTWSKEMQDYCEQDVAVNVDVYKYLESQDYSKQALKLESDFQHLIFNQTRRGIHLDVEGATKLYEEVNAELQELHERLVRTIPPHVKGTPFTPKRDNATKGYVAGQTIIRKAETPFNPGSRQQITKYLKHQYRWVPTKFTKTGAPELSEEILRNLPYPEVDDFADYLVKKKLCSTIKDAQGSWLNNHVDGIIHGELNTLGAQSHRCTHSKPNMSQTPSPKKYKGKDCRSLFYAPKGYKVVGCDASGVQLRMLGHFLYPYDGGAYAREVVDGDIHTKNQKDAGIDTRDNAKTFIYAFLFGAGGAKLGAIVKPKQPLVVQKAHGQAMKERFMTKNIAITQLLRDVNKAFKERGYLKGIDGRILVPGAEHTALNTIIQGAEAVLMKKGAVLAANEIEKRGLDAYQALHIHDEYQYIAKEEVAEEVAEILEWSIAEASEQLGYKCPNVGEAKIGNNWYETH